MRISVVSYLNSAPLVYGIRNSGYLDDCTVTLEVPAIGAAKLAEDRADVVLVPVGAFPVPGSVQWVGNYCIGVEGPVRTVCLFSDVPIERIKTVWLDNQSITSVRLIQVLASHHWKADWKFRIASDGFESRDIRDDQAGVCIGDKVFAIEKRYAFKFDLAEEWIRFTGLPFVFAAWATKKPVGKEFLDRFDSAMEFGVSALPSVAREYAPASILSEEEILEYLTLNISYPFTRRKKEGMNLFHSFLNKKEG